MLISLRKSVKYRFQWNFISFIPSLCSLLSNSGRITTQTNLVEIAQNRTNLRIQSRKIEQNWTKYCRIAHNLYMWIGKFATNHGYFLFFLAISSIIDFFELLPPLNFILAAVAFPLVSNVDKLLWLNAYSNNIIVCTKYKMKTKLFLWI